MAIATVCECNDPDHAEPCHRKVLRGRRLCSWCKQVHVGVSK